MEYTQQTVYDIVSIVRTQYYTETVIQMFKMYTETRIRPYIGIVSRIYTDSNRANKREYGLHVFMESLYNDIESVIQKIYQKILFCIHSCSIGVREFSRKKTPYSRWFYVVTVEKWELQSDRGYYKVYLQSIASMYILHKYVIIFFVLHD